LPSAAILTALLQGNAACKQESWDTKTGQNQSKMTQRFQGLENNRSILMAVKPLIIVLKSYESEIKR